MTNEEAIKYAKETNFCTGCPIDMSIDNGESCKVCEHRAFFEIAIKTLENQVPRYEMNDDVNHPSHYCTGKFECIDVMIETQGIEAVKNFCLCNAFKYIYRHNGKNGVEDIKKARFYLNKYIELQGEYNELRERGKSEGNITEV